MGKRVLFITWDGPQVTYLEGLFLPIFSQLRSRGYCFYILQFTWSDSYRTLPKIGSFANGEGYYRRVVVLRGLGFFGYIAAFFIGSLTVSSLVRRHSIDILMPRAVIPSLICMFSAKSRSVPLVFDADGLPLDEWVDFRNKSASSLVYRYFRDIEAEMVRRSNVVLTRTQAAVEILQARAGAGTLKEKFFVVRNGRDQKQFSPLCEAERNTIRSELGVGRDAPLIVYAGSLGGQYCFKEMIVFFKKLHRLRDDARFLVLTKSPEEIDYSFIADQNLIGTVLTKALQFNEVPPYLAISDLGLAFRSNKYSMMGISPVKIGEYLLCGLPVVSTRISGSEVLIQNNCGFLLDTLENPSLDSCSVWFTDEVLSDREGFRTRCRELGLLNFCKENAVEDYKRALGSLEI
jgi:glycosyltransferase involved in cell wall biosynthesis